MCCDLCVAIRGDTPHLVVVARPYRTEFFFGIQVYEPLKESGYLGYLHVVNVIGKMPQIDPDVLDIMIRIPNPIINIATSSEIPTRSQRLAT
jgi:hypothetical protein